MTQPGRNYTQTEVINKAFRSLMHNINTCIPGIVEMYDAGTRRARVKPAIQVRVRGKGFLDSPSIPNIPVSGVYASGYGIYPPVKPGDVVTLVFSQQGLSTFKRRLDNSPPDGYGFFSLQDAIAIPGWGPATITPVDGDALVIQKDDGAEYISIGDDKIELAIQNRGIFLSITASGVEIEAPTIMIRGDLTVNGQTVAAQPPGTMAASGPGSHSHGLTNA